MQSEATNNNKEGNAMRVLSGATTALYRTIRLGAGILAGFLTQLLLTGAAHAAGADVYGQPYENQIALQKGVTGIAQRIKAFDDALLLLSALVCVFVLGLLVITCIKFSAKRNPVASKTSHNTLFEVVWTLVPALILTVIAFPSVRLLIDQDNIPAGDLTIKATGNQWSWSYEYPDHGDLAFDAFMVAEEDLAPGQPRLLATDEPVVVPVNKTVRVIVTAADVIHSWAIPAFGIKMDAVPGRINETWFKAEREGTYYGQCSELCGVDHAFMPIEVKVVSDAEFKAWTQRMAGLDAPTETQLAAAQSK